MQLAANCKATSGDVKLWIGGRMASFRVDAAVGRKTGKAVETYT